MFLRKLWPAASGITHLRDLTPSWLKVEAAHIYRALTKLPQRVSRKQLKQMLPESDHSRMEQLFTTHRDIDGYDLRCIAIYGISECIRSEKFAEIIASGDLDQVGRFMQASHDGDRLFSFDQNGQSSRFITYYDDKTLNYLADNNAELSDQPGRYACSTKAIDYLVDIANATQGVIGAQIAGAGLGGCMMILVKNEALDGLLTRLREKFYSPGKLDFNVHVCSPVAGCGLFKLKD